MGIDQLKIGRQAIQKRLRPGGQAGRGTLVFQEWEIARAKAGRNSIGNLHLSSHKTAPFHSKARR
ncbi:hypothetical protein M2A_1264 [Tepidicaulis marinus]|uniref:Uncharacterized protein n=1 Tax=Tepidicaulis marinus TaxID=1333998 RepID=A0A081B9P7_9HYPH|nr:hypothetical protein M2A_1264 [Tepidicaulis marinus]